MKRSKFTDEQILAIVRKKARPDGRWPICAGRTASPRRPTTAGGELRWPRAQRDAAAEGAGRRESTAEADRGRVNAGHPGAQGNGRKKMVSTTARREAVEWLQ